MPEYEDLKPKSSLNGDVNPHIQNVTNRVNGVRKVETRPIMKGKATVRKKNAIDRLDIPGIITDAIIDKIIPDLKDIAFNSIVGVLSNGFYGDDRAARRAIAANRSSSTRTSIPVRTGGSSYNRMYGERANDRYAHPSGVYDPDDILFSDKEDARNTYYMVGELIDNYGQASIADLYDAANLSNINVSDNYGWTDISDAKIRMVRDGYILVMPRPVRLT